MTASKLNRRNILGQLIRTMLVLMLMAFIYVLLRSLGGPSKTSNTGSAFDDVVIGQTTLRRYQGKRVWATRISNAQREQAKLISRLVIDSTAGCAIESTVCVLSAATQRSGIDVVFSDQRPAQLPSDAHWYGGFVNPSTGSVFDRLGRAYKGVKSAIVVSALESVE